MIIYIIILITLNNKNVIFTGRKDMGYPARYPISSDPIPRDDIGKSSLDIISLKKYRDGISIRYFIR